MTRYQLYNIIFSAILLPTNLRCAFWLFQEAMNLTGMTFRELLAMTSSEAAVPSHGRHKFRKRQQFFIRFFNEKSSDPQKSIRLLWSFGICTLPGLAALNLAVYTAIHIGNLKYAFIGNIILVAINIALVIWGKIYRSKNPLDAVTFENLNAKRMQEKEARQGNRGKSIGVYSLVGAFFLGIFLFFMMGISDISQSQQYQMSQQSAISIHADLITILNEKGYETANIPTTYWEIDENKLLHVAAGVKGNCKFEFYGYSDDKTVDLVYNQIIHLTAQELEPSEYESHDTSLPGGSRMFTIVKDDLYYLVMYRNDTVIYAYSPDSLDEINGILTAIGYFTES